MESFNSIIRAICIKKGRGNFFTLDDFKKYVSYVSLRTELVNLVDKHYLVRIARGVYFFPHLKDGRIPIMPTVFEVVDWFKQSEKVACHPSAETAMYLVGLSSKAPESLLFYTDGGKRRLSLRQGELVCLSKSLKKVTLYSSTMVAVLVVALENVGRGNLTENQFICVRKFAKSIAPEVLTPDMDKIPEWIKSEFLVLC